MTIRRLCIDIIVGVFQHVEFDCVVRRVKHENRGTGRMT